MRELPGQVDSDSPDLYCKPANKKQALCHDIKNVRQISHKMSFNCHLILTKLYLIFMIKVKIILTFIFINTNVSDEN